MTLIVWGVIITVVVVVIRRRKSTGRTFSLRRKKAEQPADESEHKDGE